MQRQYLGCAGKVANGINTVHLAYVRERGGRALIGCRQWLPRAQIEDPAKSVVMGLPPDLEFQTKGQLAIDIAADALADGTWFDFLCGDEVYGSCTQLREFFEDGTWASSGTTGRICTWVSGKRPGGPGLLRAHAFVPELAVLGCLLVDPPAVGFPRRLPGRAQGRADLRPGRPRRPGRADGELAAASSFAGDRFTERQQLQGFLLRQGQ